MKSPRFWLSVLVAGVVANVIDMLVHPLCLKPLYYDKIDSMRQDANIAWFVIGDFFAVLVLAIVYDRVASAFARGAKGGAAAGFFLGVLVTFPTFHFIQLTFKNYPYSLVWILTVVGILWYVIIGAMLGAMMNAGAAENKAA